MFTFSSLQRPQILKAELVQGMVLFHFHWRHFDFASSDDLWSSTGTIYSANIAAEKYNKQMVALDSLLRSLDLVSTMTEPSTSNHNILLGAIIKQD